MEHAFKFNDAVLRHLVVKTDKAETGPSLMMKAIDKEAKRAAAAAAAASEAAAA
jgi:small subunit ribosomal protein S6